MVELNLRRVNADDIKTIFEWRNNPWIVSLSLSGDTVSWNQHQIWFAGMLTNPDIRLFVIEHNGIAKGQLRFDRKQEQTEASITVYLLKEHTGQGIGTKTIIMGCQSIFEEWPDLECIRASILNRNKESQKAFTKAGFVTEAEYSKHFEMVLNKNNG